MWVLEGGGRRGQAGRAWRKAPEVQAAECQLLEMGPWGSGEAPQVWAGKGPEKRPHRLQRPVPDSLPCLLPQNLSAVGALVGLSNARLGSIKTR